MTELSPALTREAILEHTQHLADSAAATGPDAHVPTTPQWTVTDLVRHVGQTQHWVAEIVERRITDPTRLPTNLSAVPHDPDQWRSWLSESAHRITSAFSDDALDAPVLNAAGDHRTGTQFWMSGQLNEAVVHSFDAATAAGRPVDIDPAIAAALISNHLRLLTSPTWELQRPASAHALRGKGQTLQWLATDTVGNGGAWLVERGPDRATWHDGTEQADVTVTGPARLLLLTLTRRIPFTGGDETGLHVHGDLDLVRHWLDHSPHVTN